MSVLTESDKAEVTRHIQCLVDIAKDRGEKIIIVTPAIYKSYISSQSASSLLLNRIVHEQLCGINHFVVGGIPMVPFDGGRKAFDALLECIRTGAK